MQQPVGPADRITLMQQSVIAFINCVVFTISFVPLAELVSLICFIAVIFFEVRLSVAKNYFSQDEQLAPGERSVIDAIINGTIILFIFGEILLNFVEREIFRKITVETIAREVSQDMYEDSRVGIAAENPYDTSAEFRLALNGVRCPSAICDFPLNSDRYISEKLSGSHQNVSKDASGGSPLKSELQNREYPFNITNKNIRHFLRLYHPELHISSNMPIFRIFTFKNLKFNPTKLAHDEDAGEYSDEDSHKAETDDGNQNYDDVFDEEEVEGDQLMSIIEVIQHMQEGMDGSGRMYIKALSPAYYKNRGG